MALVGGEVPLFSSGMAYPSWEHNHLMKHEYCEGVEALEKFKRGMEALFKVPKSAVQAKKKQAPKPATLRKSKKSGKDKV